LLSRRRLLLGWLGLTLGVATPALAEDPPRRVGSLDYVSGEVVYALQGDASDPGRSSWLQADPNQPIAEDMSVQTGPLARARIRIGPNAVEIAADSELDVLNLTDQLVEAGLRQGRVFLQIHDLQEGERVEIEIPTGSLWLLKPGAYDIDAGAGDRPARVAVSRGPRGSPTATPTSASRRGRRRR
jgi:hypothetical protein